MLAVVLKFDILSEAEDSMCGQHGNDKHLHLTANIPYDILPIGHHLEEIQYGLSTMTPQWLSRLTWQMLSASHMYYFVGFTIEIYTPSRCNHFIICDT